MSYSAETPYVASTETDQAFETVQTEFGEELLVAPFVRGRQSDDRLKLSLIRKVSPTGVFLQNRGWIPTTPNSFGLPPGETCPGKTEFCESCYAFGSIRSKGVKEMLDGNLALLASLENQAAVEVYLSEMVQRYDDAATANGVAERDRVFRIHWSGDFYSVDYAKSWARVVRQFPHIQFWAYTRSFHDPVDVVPVLDGIDNLELFLSVDTGNIDQVSADYDHIRRANSALDVLHANQLARDEVKTITCPENLDRLKLMQEGEGACIKCRLCFDERRSEPVDINFVTSGKHDATPRSRFAHDVVEQPVVVASSLSLAGVRRSRYITNRRPE